MKKVSNISYKNNSNKTYFYDCIRGPFYGMIYYGLMAMTMLVAIRHYKTDSFYIKSVLSIGESIGRLMNPIGLYLTYKSGLKTSYISAIYMIFTSLFLILAALSPELSLYLTAIILSYTCFTQTPQLMLNIYSKNYNKDERGSKVSMMFFLSTSIGSIFSFLIGNSMDLNFNFYRYQFYIISLCALCCAYSYFNIPSDKLSDFEAGNPLSNLKLLWQDKLFGLLCLGSVMLGLGTGMVGPIRVEYLSKKIYEINASISEITLITVGIPGILMIISSKLWGFIFDKINFIIIRLLINFFFIISYILFFCSKNLSSFIISSVFYGLAMSGSMLIWQLWVTKIASKDKVLSYMSVNGTCSGIKGTIAPFIGFALMQYCSPKIVGICASFLIIISSIIFLAGFKNPRIQ